MPLSCLVSNRLAENTLVCLVQDKESELDKMYSRGIDPSMADPTQCHSHPDAPSEWPRQPEVQAYVQKVSRKTLWTVMAGMKSVHAPLSGPCN